MSHYNPETRTCHKCGKTFETSKHSSKNITCYECSSTYHKACDVEYQRRKRHERKQRLEIVTGLPLDVIPPKARVRLGWLAEGRRDSDDGYAAKMRGHEYEYWELGEMPQGFLPEGITFQVFSGREVIASGQVINGLPRVIATFTKA